MKLHERYRFNTARGLALTLILFLGYFFGLVSLAKNSAIWYDIKETGWAGLLSLVLLIAAVFFSLGTMWFLGLLGGDDQ